MPLFYLGQAVKVKPVSPAGEFFPGILVGYTTHDLPIVTYKNNKNEILEKEKVLTYELDFVRQPSKVSPSGKSVYLGKFCKVGYYAKVTLKIPNDLQLKTELKKIEKLIK